MDHPLCFDSTRLTCPFIGAGHDDWRRSVRRFVDREIAPHVNNWDENGGFPRELHINAAEIGLIGLGFPEELGGVSENVDVFHSIIAAEELARAGSGGLVAGLMTHGIGL
ncbi:MAG: acyl-CoA dehydrogenase family protein, partial [Parvularculaceae bacterium]|nr:acyl-CoA dehydrogenase family protein [Parvularculaceae bacterium]